MKPDTEESHAYRRGKAAYARGLLAGDNPYKWGSAYWREWKRGWMDEARRDSERDDGS